jgi:DNA invertase Pin-like site-specific DNA recombinase
VNHKDGLRDHNNYKNLEWCTGLQNMRHAIEVLGRKMGGNCGGLPKMRVKDILRIRELSRIGVTYREIALIFSIRTETVLNIVTRKSWKHI